MISEIIIQRAAEMTFHGAPKPVTVSSPEQLARRRIWISPEIIEGTWGIGAAKRFNQVYMSQGPQFEPVSSKR